MPFYKKTEEEELLVAPNFVHGPGFSLLADDKDTYEYPVDGWYWYENLDAALMAFASNPPADEWGIARWQGVKQLKRTANPNAPGTCWDAVQYLLTQLEGEALDDAQTVLNDVMNWKRTSPTLNAMAGAAGWGVEFVDQLFRDAGGIEL